MNYKENGDRRIQKSLLPTLENTEKKEIKEQRKSFGKLIEKE